MAWGSDKMWFLKKMKSNYGQASWRNSYANSKHKSIVGLRL